MLTSIRRLSGRSLLVVAGMLALVGVLAASILTHETPTQAAATSSVLRGGIVLNEILIDPNGTNNFDTDGNGTADTPDEFVEVYNLSGSAINLDGLQLWDAGGDNWFTFPTGTTLPAGGYAVVVAGVQSGGSLPAVSGGNLAFDAGDSGGTLNNGGDNVVLYDPDPLENKYIQLRYNGDAADDPTTDYTGFSSTATLVGSVEDFGSDTDGVSLVREPAGDTNVVSHTTVSTENASPGAASSGTADDPPTVSSTTPVDSATGVAVNTNIAVTFSEPVNLSADWLSVDCSTSGVQTLGTAASGASFTLDPATDFANEETCTVTIAAARVADQDGSADNLAQDYGFSFTTIPAVANGCGETATLISTIQGSGLTSPEDGNVHTIEGIVVGDFQEGDNDATPALPGYDSDLDGFYIQEEAADQDNNPATSEGIFVFTGNAGTTVPDVSAGEVVRVTGEVTEFNDLTELTSVSAMTSCGSGTLPAPMDIELPVDPRTNLERYEGMLVRFPQTLVIAEYFNFDRFGEIVLALPLDNRERPFQPTSYIDPGPEVDPVAEAIELRRITLDDARTSQNPDPARHPNGAEFTLDNRFRGGDTVQNAVGVLDYRFDKYRLQPTDAADYTATNPRLAAPEDVGGSLTVASFNVLNYFTTLGERGADDAAEFTRQREKIIAALTAIDADLVGLIEIENNTAALQDLVSGLNSAVGAGTYAAIETGAIGTDAIKVALIYKPGSVTPTGDFAVLDAPSFTNPNNLDTPKNRPALAQTFTEDATGERFTVVVNHFKSKGSDCGGPPDDDPQQGNCNGTRTAAANVLLDWLATDPTGSTDPDMLILGDLNAYDEEDPIDAIKAGADDIVGTTDDYTDLIEQFQGEFAYSFVFDGQFGYLDYALANQALLTQVTGTTEWHINADEPDILDYDTTFKQAAQAALYQPNPYRSSDHDPVIVGLRLGEQPAQLSLPLVAR
jgi:predicted extracellular nuclease